MERGKADGEMEKRKEAGRENEEWEAKQKEERKARKRVEKEKVAEEKKEDEASVEEGDDEDDGVVYSVVMGLDESEEEGQESLRGLSPEQGMDKENSEDEDWWTRTLHGNMQVAVDSEEEEKSSDEGKGIEKEEVKFGPRTRFFPLHSTSTFDALIFLSERGEEKEGRCYA